MPACATNACLPNAQFLLSFSGFLVSDVPVYFKWVQKISMLTYAYAASE